MKMKFEVHSGKLAVAVLFMFWLRYTIWQYSIVDYQLADQVCSPGFQAGLSTAGFPSAPCQRVQPVFILISIHLIEENPQTTMSILPVLIKGIAHNRGESSDDYVDPGSAHQRHRAQDHPEVSTPLMYIIHTSESSSEQFSATDDDGGAASCVLSILALMLSLLLCIVDGLG
uniref:Secreted protein n=1 Tax=Ascaris lumbricoides TaxID=6252 RepID=A0A0M3IRV7_ASCLU